MGPQQNIPSDVLVLPEQHLQIPGLVILLVMVRNIIQSRILLRVLMYIQAQTYRNITLIDLHYMLILRLSTMVLQYVRLLTLMLRLFILYQHLSS